MKIELIYFSVVAVEILSWILIRLDQTFSLLMNKISESLLKLQMKTVSRLTTKIRSIIFYKYTCSINLWSWSTSKFRLSS